MFSPCRWAPKMWTGNPSADASRWLSPVMMQQEKSRALEMTAERAARSSVLVISRTMPSSRLAITVMRTESRGAFFPPRRVAEGAPLPRLAREGGVETLRLGLASAFAIGGIRALSGFQDIVPGWADERA